MTRQLLRAGVLLATALSAPVALCAGTSPIHEILRVRIVNDANGEIAVSRDRGATWQGLGRVLRYTARVNPKGYTASKWVPAGRVAATAVNAIHISAGYNAAEDRGIVFSILPREFLSAPPTYTSFLSPDSSIYTDLPAGQGIFGGGGAPLVGNRVYCEREDGTLTALGEGYVPARGDALVIVAERPARYPTAVVFENWEGGAVTLGCSDGSRELLGWVVKPVQGVGRFLGAVYAGAGRIRANHAGVVDVSTSPLGDLGGFQIIPLGHALSPEMGNAWRLTQWMIVGPVSEDTRLWDGLSPLFGHYLRPDYLSDDLYRDDWRERLLSRFLVEVDLGGGWRAMPALRLSPDPEAPLPTWASEALRQARRFRILFPLAERRNMEGIGTGRASTGRD
jgi:hypothetical protein